jgi:hypothetical protein
MGMGVSALSGLGGYVGLGGKAAVPIGTRTVGGEVLLARDGGSIQIDEAATLTWSRSRSVHLVGRELHPTPVIAMARTT